MPLQLGFDVADYAQRARLRVGRKRADTLRESRARIEIATSSRAAGPAR